jgi:hypothetical protein
MTIRVTGGGQQPPILARARSSMLVTLPDPPIIDHRAYRPRATVSQSYRSMGGFSSWRQLFERWRLAGVAPLSGGEVASTWGTIQFSAPPGTPLAAFDGARSEWLEGEKGIPAVNPRVETMEDVAQVRRWLADQVREGNGLARRFLRVLDRAAPGEEIATARVVVRVIFQVAGQADTLLRARYEAIGSPYGESDEGLARWVAERQEAERQRRTRLN